MKTQINPNNYCNCCASTNINVNICNTTNCDYNMCNNCYNTYYSKNTKCPACRYEVETNLLKSDSDSDLDSEDEQEEENNNYIIYSCCCCEIKCYNYSLGGVFNNFINKIRNDIFYQMLLDKLFILFLKFIFSLFVICWGRLIFILTILAFYPELPNITYFINDFGWFLVSSLIGLALTILYLFVIVTVINMCFSPERD